MDNDPHNDDIESMLDEQLEQIEKAEKRKHKFYKKLHVKRGMLVIGILLLMSAAGILSLVSGINSAVNKNEAIIAESKREADKKGIVKLSAKGLALKKQATSNKTKVKLEDLQRKALIENREDNNEKQRLSDAKASNRSVIAKLDVLKNDVSSEREPLSRFNKINHPRKNIDLSAALQRLFNAGFNLPGATSESQQNFEWLVAANTGGQNADRFKASIEYHKIDLSNTFKQLADQNAEEHSGDDQPTSDGEPNIKTNKQSSLADNRSRNTEKKKLGITRQVTQEESAMLLMQIDSSKDSPITARIMDTRSDLDGAKLACEFNLTQDQQAVQIKCNKLVIQHQSYSVNIIMLDPATRNANIADKVDTHWWKWLAFSATTFAEGYLNFATTKTTVINTDGSQTSQTAAIQDAGERNRAAIANIGQRAIATGGNILDIPNQVLVDEYRPVILLYLDDLNI
ncbi:MAG: hypothetical protein Q9M92_04180 [Enterobacterales bacterium]|nr:hypothetical protein [Enterobacterales bacterium]